MTNVQYASIGTQVNFLDTIKYYHQSLSSLAKNANDIKKGNKRQPCRRFIENNITCSLVFNYLFDGNKNWVLDYFWWGKRVIPYERIKTYEDLNCVSEGDFFTKTEFYSSLKHEILGHEDYENVKNFGNFCFSQNCLIFTLLSFARFSRIVVPKWWTNSRTILENVLLPARSVAASIDTYSRQLWRSQHRLKPSNY